MYIKREREINVLSSVVFVIQWLNQNIVKISVAKQWIFFFNLFHRETATKDFYRYIGI